MASNPALKKWPDEIRVELNPHFAAAYGEAVKGLSAQKRYEAIVECAVGFFETGREKAGLSMADIAHPENIEETLCVLLMCAEMIQQLDADT